MAKYKFYKEHGVWFIDLKWFPKRWKHHLAMVAGSDEMLDKIGEGKAEVILEVSTRMKYHNQTIINRKIILPTLIMGAIYEPFNFRLENEILEKNQLWICWVTLLVFGRYPKSIYFHVVKKP